MKRVSFSAVALTALFVLACGDNGGPSDQPDASPGVDAAIATVDLVAVAGDFDATGVYSIVKVPRGGAADMPNALAGVAGGDPVVRRFGDELIIVNRLGGDNVTIVNGRSHSLVRQIATPAGSNPQDVAVVENKLYVPALASSDLLVFDKSTGAALPGIDLSSLDAADDQPDCVSAVAVGSKVFVACGQLDENFAARGVGKLAVIDTSDDSLETMVDLPVNNPTGFLQTTPSASVFAGDLLVPMIPDYVDTTTSCIARVATTSPYASSCAITGTELGGYPNRVEASRDGLLLWIVVNGFGAAPFGHLRGFDLGSGDLWPGSVSPEAQVITDVTVCEGGYVVVSDRADGASGLRLYNGVTEQTTAPIAIGLAPGYGNNLACMD